jgi:hypothetical protein
MFPSDHGTRLFYGDTARSAAMRHELRVAIGDPFLLGIVDGRLHVEASPRGTRSPRSGRRATTSSSPAT